MNSRTRFDRGTVAFHDNNAEAWEQGGESPANSEWRKAWKKDMEVSLANNMPNHTIAQKYHLVKPS